MRERRTLPRVFQNQTVRITVLNPPQDVPVEGVCIDMSLVGGCFRLAAGLAPGTLVRIEAGDALWLGEVVHCRPEQDGFVAGMHFEHSLMGLSQLQRTLQRLEWSPEAGSRTSSRA